MTVQSRPPAAGGVHSPGLHADLLGWFAAAGRDLPWRRTRDAWTILVSEVMLQQTQVSRVVQGLPAFLARFPSPAVCAESSPAEVISAWNGLGYNRRAANLHATARRIRDDHGGVVPRDLEDLLALPGVGPYTARAVRVFAHEQVEAVLDTNTGRVLARVHHRRLTPARAQRLADELVLEDRPWEWNQALVDLGAQVCRPSPRCHECPISRHCGWFAAGRPHPDPIVGSAGASRRQAPFEGSDRQGRGRLLRRLASGPLRYDAAGSLLEWAADPQRTRRVIDGLIADGLIAEANGYLRLP